MSGFSLIEVLLGLVLGMIILLGGYGALQTLEYQSEHYQWALEQQHNQSLAIQLLQQAISAAGLPIFGAMNSQEYFINLTTDNSGRVDLQPDHAVQVYTQQQPELMALKIPLSSLGDSDVLVIRQVSDDNAVLPAPLPADTITLILPHSLEVAVNDVLLLQDSTHFIADQVSAVNQHAEVQYVTLTRPIPVAMEKGALVHLFYWFAYYEADTDRKHADGQPITALYIQDQQGRRYELVPDVTAFHIDINTVQAKPVGIKIALTIGADHKTVQWFMSL